MGDCFVTLRGGWRVMFRHGVLVPSKCVGTVPLGLEKQMGTFRIESLLFWPHQMKRHRSTHHRASHVWQRMSLA